MRKKISSGLVLALLTSVSSFAQSAAVSAAHKYRTQNEHRLLTEFVDLLSIPNVAGDAVNIDRNARYLFDELQKRGLRPRLLRTEDGKAPPVVYGEFNVPGAAKTIVFYAHYDGQPTDTDDWNGSAPWKPVLRTGALEKGGKTIEFPKAGALVNPDWRVYARSASDDKAGVFTILSAFDALKASGISPTINLKFFFEGEEEAGSPHLGEILSKNRDLLKSDAWIICDGPVHQSGRKLVSFGVRGVTSVDLTVYGANRDLHSGHYGNWAPNPGSLLVRLLASMKDKNGRVTIDGWYDDVEPLGKLEIQAIKQAPKNDDELRRQLGLGRTEGEGKSLLELLNQPSLNINGMKIGNVGALARNVIPATANVVLGLRLVKGNDHRRQVAKLRRHIEKEDFLVLDRDPTADERNKYPLIAKFLPENAGYNAQRTRMDLPISRAVVKAVRSSRKLPIVVLPTMGGSLPLSVITETLDLRALITVPIVNYDNNQHAANENVRIGNLWDGLEIYAALLTLEFSEPE